MSALASLASRLGPRPARKWHRVARPEQLPPEGEWRIWLAVAGRGWGKTRSGSEWLLEQALTTPGDYCALAPTFGSARDVCAEGPSGLETIAQRGEITSYTRSLGEIRVANGSRIYLRSADEPDRLRGFNFHCCWCDELATWRNAERVWHEALMPSVRLDPALVCITTTPRPIPLLRDLLGRSDGTVVVVRGSTFDNARNLSRTALAELRERYEGTRLGRQELGGELLEDVEGALWTLAMFDEARMTELPELERVVVGVDPAVTSASTSDETGIVVAGVAGTGSDAQFYVLADESLRASPHRWASRVVSAYRKWDADRVVVEVNQGGDLVADTLSSISANLPVQKVRATRGKQVRAEPIVSLYEQGRVHHVGVLAELEEQATTWVPSIGRSPDRVDALVWALTALSEGRRRFRIVRTSSTTLRARERAQEAQQTVVEAARAAQEVPYRGDPMVVPLRRR